MPTSIIKSTLTNDIFKIINWFRINNYIDQQSYSDYNNRQPLIPTISQLKVMKLLYYVQGVSLSFYNMRAFPNRIYHWEYGPAIPEVHQRYKGMTALPRVDQNQTVYNHVYHNYKQVQANSKLYKAVVGVNHVYGDMSAYGLMMQTHSESPWLDTFPSEEIKPVLIKRYFDKNVVE